MSLSSENRLGVDCTQTKVDMGPIECVHLIHFDIKRVLVNFRHQIGTLLGAQSLGDITHVR